MNTYDLEFLSRMMGAPAHLNRIPGDGGLSANDLQKWVGLAAANPEKRGQAPGRMGVLQDDLALVAIRANSTPVEEPKDPPRATSSEMRIQHPQGGCACESGLSFRDCHGADSMADEQASG